MKILYFTDTHIRGTNPKNRVDNFLETLKEKFNEVVDICNRENVDFILHGGDLFDRPDISVSIVGEFAKILNKFKSPIYVLSGNHDIFGHNPDTINRTMLGLLENTGVIKLVNNKKIILESDIKVQLTGFPYIFGMDEGSTITNYLVKEVDETCIYSIHMTHGFLIDKPFREDVPHTLIEDIKDTLADITLGAHYHYGFKTHEIDGKYFVNPGALVRISNSLIEIKRRPKVIIIELNNSINIREVYLNSAKPGEEVLDRSEMERHKFKGIKFNEFKEIIDSSSDLNNLDIMSILLDISDNENISEEVREEARKRIEKVQIDGAQNK